MTLACVSCVSARRASPRNECSSGTSSSACSSDDDNSAPFGESVMELEVGERGAEVAGFDAGMDDRLKLQDENIDAILSRIGGCALGGDDLRELESPLTSGEACVVGGEFEEISASLVPSALSALPGRGATVENRDARCEMNDPILVPHVLNVAFVSDAA